MGAHGSASSPTDVRLALDAFRAIVQALRSSSRDVERRVGLTSAQLFALQQLAAAPSTSINDLATRTFTHQSSVSVVVQRLAERRLVAKVAARDDRRRVTLTLTEAGRAILRRSPQPVQERLIAGIGALSSRDRRVLAAALGGVARAMGAATGSPPMLFEDRAAQSPRRGSSARKRLAARHTGRRHT
jgi:DNA-binding MarR family transcriptional regulator